MKILAVDDEVQVCKFLKDMLIDMGHEAQVACSGAEALRLIENSFFDLVLLDINMPDMSGLEVIKELKKRNNSIKIIVLSAVDNEHVQSYAGELGANGYIIKPIRYDYLKKMISEQIGKITEK